MTEDAARVAAYFENATIWKAELAAFRSLLRASPLTEEFKWRSPCYTFEGGNVATVWNFKAFCGLGFFKGALLRDPAGVLAAPGENSRAMRVFQARSVAQIETAQNILASYIEEAIGLERSGRKVDFDTGTLTGPAELDEALAADPALRAAFEALTPGRQRGYRLHFSDAKQPATRRGRIGKSAPRILAGKGLQDR